MQAYGYLIRMLVILSPVNHGQRYMCIPDDYSLSFTRQPGCPRAVIYIDQFNLYTRNFHLVKCFAVIYQVILDN